ncbi:MAG: HEAT repeat domain-containing protein [Candidatus Diapherotrites archaeon]|nr:HEAT repeat domain-containing protein [Candidatus Diapherotrites archaeon]
MRLGPDTEDNLNAILGRLQEEWDNSSAGGLRDELISACAVTLNGLGKIRGPVTLFRNLGLTFENRAHCIYTPTVRNAFNRLYLNAIKNGKQKEVFDVWRRFGNPLTKANAGKYVPLHALEALLDHPQDYVQMDAARMLGSRKDGSMTRLKDLLGSSNSNIRRKAARELGSCKDFPLTGLKGLLHSGDWFIELGAAEALSSRLNFPLKKLKGLLTHPHEQMRKLAAEALGRRKDLPSDELRALLQHRDNGVAKGAKDALASRSRLPNPLFPLKGIHGKRKQRKEEMHRRMQPLRG